MPSPILSACKATHSWRLQEAFTYPHPACAAGMHGSSSPSAPLSADGFWLSTASLRQQSLRRPHGRAVSSHDATRNSASHKTFLERKSPQGNARMSSRRFGDAANTRKPNKFGMVPAWWINKLGELPASACAVALTLCLDINNETGITRKSRTMTEWAKECVLDRGTLRMSLIDLTLAGMTVPERNITTTGQREARTPFRIQILFSDPDDKKVCPTDETATATSSNSNDRIQDQPQRQRTTTRPRSQTLDCASEERFKNFPALNADEASIERGKHPQRSQTDNAGKSRNELEPGWLNEPDVFDSSYEPGADAEVLGAP